jgi:hypothetical protein
LRFRLDADHCEKSEGLIDAASPIFLLRLRTYRLGRDRFFAVDFYTGAIYLPAGYANSGHSPSLAWQRLGLIQGHVPRDQFDEHLRQHRCDGSFALAVRSFFS